MHPRVKDPSLLLYKYSIIQTVTFIGRKVVYSKKHLKRQEYEAQETKFPLPLNVSYRRETIKLAVGAMREPIHT